MHSQKDQQEVVVKSVFANDLETEFGIIRRNLERFPIVSFDTEFPGTVIHPTCQFLGAEDNYKMLKQNVDATNIIQLGLTLSNNKGEILKLGSKSFIWEFNFKDFDLTKDLYNKDSIELLKKQGIDFERNRKEGIDSLEFAKFMINSGLVRSSKGSSVLTWIGFQSSYDFGYLVKILTRKELPDNLHEFLNLVEKIFGRFVYDVKHMMKHCSGLFGGLDKVAKALEVERVAGKSHLAGSDSLLTMMTYMKMKQDFFGDIDTEFLKHSGIMHGIEMETNRPPPPSICQNPQVYVQRPPLLPCQAAPPPALLRQLAPSVFLRQSPAAPALLPQPLPPAAFMHNYSKLFVPPHQISVLGYNCNHRVAGSLSVMAV